MRVLAVTTVHTPLDARIHRRQVGALLEAGHEVLYAAPFAGYDVSPARVDPRLETIDLPRARRWHRLRALGAARACLRRHAGRVDVAILHDPELLLAAAGLRRRLPRIWDVHEDLAASFEDKPWVPASAASTLRRTVRWLEAWAERNMALILAEDAYGARFTKLHPVVPNLPPLPPPPRGPQDDRVVYIGRISRLRGAGELVLVGAALAAMGIVLEVLGPVDHDVSEQVRAAERAGHLRALGFVPNDVAMARLDGALAGLSLLHDHPNYRHSMPTKVVEYQAAGVPVITTPLPSAAAMVSAAGSGMVVPFHDVDAVVAAIGELADDRERASALGAAGRAAAEAGLSWDAVAPTFVAFVEEVATSPDRGPRRRQQRR